MPPETQGEVVIDGHRTESSWIANKVTVGRYGADFNSIQAAIDYCDAIGDEWTIQLWPYGIADWVEGDITPGGGANITIKGMGKGRVTIAPVAAGLVTAPIVSAHTLSLEDIIVTAPTNAFPAVRVTAGTLRGTSCELNGVGVGDATQQVGGNIELHNCSIPAGAISSSAGITRLVGCFHRGINRTGTGNIVDQSPWLGDQPWHVEKWSWQAALANSQVAVRGTPRDDGSGQVLLEVNLDIADVEAVEALPAVGSFPNTVDPAKTPRMITQYLWDYTGAYEHVFIGLRHTLGDAYPVANEDCAGFVYDTTLSAPDTFFTYTIRGANVQLIPITAPGHAVQIQLEIIVFGGVMVEFYIDGVLVATHTTQVPSDALYWQHLLVTDGLGGDTDIDVAIRNGGVQECPI